MRVPAFAKYRAELFLKQLQSLYKIPYHEIFGTSDIEKILVEHCSDYLLGRETWRECRERLYRLYREKVVEEAVVKKKPRIVALELKTREMLGILAEKRETPTVARPVEKVRVPAHALSALLEEMGRYAELRGTYLPFPDIIEKLKKQYKQVAIVSAPYRFEPYPTYLILYYNIALKPRTCYYDTDRRTFFEWYGCDKPTLLVAELDDKAIIVRGKI